MKRLFALLLILVCFSIQAQEVMTFQQLQEKYADGQKAAAEGRYEDAINIFQKMARYCEDNNKPIALSGVLNELGGCYLFSGQFDKGLEVFNRSIQLKKDLGLFADLLPTYNNLANLFYTFGNNDKAMEFFQLGLDVMNQVNDNKAKGEFLYNLGYFYYTNKKYDLAVQYMQQSIPMLTTANDFDYLAFAAYMMAEMSYKVKDYDQANTYLEQAMAAQRKLKKFDDLSKSFNLAAMIAEEKGDIMKATISFQLSAEIVPQGKETKGTATSWYNLGRLYVRQNDLVKAEECFKKAVDIIEKVRMKASGPIRRDFMQLMVDTYSYLTAIYLRNAQPANAFNNVETMSGKYLIDQLGEKLKDQSVSFTDIEKYRSLMDDKTAVLCFSNVSLSSISTEYIGIASFCASKAALSAFEIDSRNFSNNLMLNSGKIINNTVQQLRGFKPLQPIEGVKVNEQQSAQDFEKIINTYRQLLSISQPTPDEQKITESISTGLYNLLITPFEKQLTGKSELVIIPGDILAFIPFETLKAKDGKYLIEKFNVRYTQSLTVSELLSKRTYSNTREEMLAIGNAFYMTDAKESSKRSFKKLQSDEEYNNLRFNALSLIDSKPNKVGELYPRYGIGEWDNLTGTEKELQNILLTYPFAKIVSGTNANETAIKEFSKNGELKKYRTIHFAAHGLALPELPELSTLVLSLSDTANSPDDGYLRMSEIASLDLNCDFVNLSACETGLGRIYGGEGVVGLTQSFLIAGTNSLSVSLWQVADQSTMEFMSGFYELVKEKKLTHSQAMREMKLRFIKGQYKNPFNWAPFVYYGM